jgi:carbonic anhydrase
LNIFYRWPLSIFFVQKIADKNVEMTVNNITAKSEVLKDMVEAGELKIIGAMYDVNTGKVTFTE